MINLIQVNLPAVVVASVVAMGVGFVWYHPKVFGDQWMKLQGLSKQDLDKSSMGMKFGIMFLATLVSGYILSIFIHYAGAYNLILGAKTGLWVWLGFIMPAGLANHLFSRKPLKFYLIQTGHHLTGLLIMGAILGSWF